MEEVLYTVNEVSKLIKSNTAYVYKLIRTGYLPVLKLGGYKVRRTALLNFLEKYEGKDLTNPEDIKDLGFKKIEGDLMSKLPTIEEKNFNSNSVSENRDFMEYVYTRIEKVLKEDAIYMKLRSNFVKEGKLIDLKFQQEIFDPMESRAEEVSYLAGLCDAMTIINKNFKF